MVKKMLANKKGFSLIELIVVIAILGVIAVIAVPSVMNTLAKSKVDADVQSAQAIIRATTQAYISLNTDADPNNNLGQMTATPLCTINNGTITPTASLANIGTFIDLKKVCSSNPTTTFSIAIDTANPADDKNPNITVTFNDGTKTHSIDKTGRDNVGS